MELRPGRWSPLRAGHILRGGVYRILEPLGRGGMGALYLAADTCAFDRRCVVKELLDYYDPTDPEEARQAEDRFETEGRLLAELSHPGIPRIYSYFSEAGRHYIVMEYIEGDTLERAVSHFDALNRPVAARPLAPEDVVRHAVRICRVLEYLAGRPTLVVHQDIKPANLIVDRNSGEVRLVDFGTARNRTRWATQARLDQGMSALFGTEGYAAPEQYQGRSEARSDVYALAGTVYHLLTDDDPGGHPFRFPHLDRLPGPLAHALSRALHLEVGRRSTAAEFRQALEGWLIPEDGGQPFVFRSGAVAQTTSELVLLCDLHWEEARQHLANGDFERWFRARSRHDLVAKVESARLDTDPDAALEGFLHRLDPRLPAPRLAVEPAGLEFEQPAGSVAVQQITLRNQGRGYARVTFQASVPWLNVEPSQAGCLAGLEVPVSVAVDRSALRLRREHQAIINCAPTRGAQVSIPVAVEMSLGREIARRLVAGLRPALAVARRGARRGLGLWVNAFRNMTHSRWGGGILGGEIVVLAAAMVALHVAWSDASPGLEELAWQFLQALPLAIAAALLLPLLALILGSALVEGAKNVIKRKPFGRLGR